MTSVLTAGEYRDQLRVLLANCQTSLTEDELQTLRAIVRERRNRRPGREPMTAATEIAQRADAIVRLLESAARDLRPRQTQELDDFVAGKEPTARPASYDAPVRLRRRGRG